MKALFEALAKHIPSPGPCNNVGLNGATTERPCGFCAVCSSRWEEEAQAALATLSTAISTRELSDIASGVLGKIVKYGDGTAFTWHDVAQMLRRVRGA